MRIQHVAKSVTMKVRFRVMSFIRFMDLLANTGELRSKFENAFYSVGIETKCVSSARFENKKILFTNEKNKEEEIVEELTEVSQESMPIFDFLLAAFPFQHPNEHQSFRELLFHEIIQIVTKQKPYGFIVEKTIAWNNANVQSQLETVTEQFPDFVQSVKMLGYKLSWRLLDNDNNNDIETSKRVFILGTLGSENILANFEKDKQNDMLQFIAQHNQTDASSEVSKVQKELFTALLEEKRRTAIKKAPQEPMKTDDASREEDKPNKNEKEVYFKLYPPKKLLEVTKEDGSVTGLVHSFIFQEVFEETMKELDITKSLNSDLKAIFTSSDEQILVIDENGFIIRASRAFFSNFWNVKNADDIIGKNIQEFVDQNIFQPNIFRLCINKQEKVTAIQESGNMRIWSVANPVFTNGQLEKVVVLSKEIMQDGTHEQENDHGNDVMSFANFEDEKLIYRSAKIDNIVTQLTRAAKMHSTILIEGETGVGKELFAHKVHEQSARNHQPLIRINCGAIPEQLIESELFGYEKGAFTGADQKGKIGFFELADKGTIFLDEIGELPLNMQVKLLRVLQEREITRIGGTHPISIDVRIIAATNRNLKKLVDRGEFREDLYYRLNVIPFNIPSLKERKEDVFPLAVYFLEQQKHIYNINISFSPEAIEVLETYDWPGNIRELQNIIERLLIFTDEEWIQREHVLTALYGSEKQDQRKISVQSIMPLKEAIKEVEHQLIELGLRQYDTAAELAKHLEVSPATLSRRIKEIKETYY